KRFATDQLPTNSFDSYSGEISGRWAKSDGIRPHTGNLPRVQIGRQFTSADEIGADDFEWSIGPPADRVILRAFEHRDPRIQYCGGEAAYIRGRVDPRQAGGIKPIAAAPIFHADDLQIGAQILFAIEHFRQLADGHSVPDRYGEVADHG